MHRQYFGLWIVHLLDAFVLYILYQDFGSSSLRLENGLVHNLSGRSSVYHMSRATKDLVVNALDIYS